MKYTNRDIKTPFINRLCFKVEMPDIGREVMFPESARQMEKDIRTLMLRLYGEDPDTMSPECREVFDRWYDEITKMIQEPGKPLENKDE